MANTLYDTLEVIPTASPETIHAAYRSLISRYHPDKVAGLGPELQAIANVRTKEINHAYDILGHAARRASYDKELRDIESPPLQQRYAAAAQRAAAARPVVDKPRGRRLRAPFVAALAAVAALLTLPHAANFIFGVVDFLVTGHTRYFQDFVNSVDADVRYSGFPYLLILWGWLFVGYLFGLISYLFGMRVGEGIALRFGEPFAGTNERLFLFLTFVCVIAARELFFSAHTLAGVLTDMFVLAGAYRAALGTASSTAMPEAQPEGESVYRS